MAKRNPSHQHRPSKGLLSLVDINKVEASVTSFLSSLMGALPAVGPAGHHSLCGWSLPGLQDTDFRWLPLLL